MSAASCPLLPLVDNAMVKALARAFRWRKMLDTGVHATIDDLARAKGVNTTYVSRILRLTLLAPEIALLGLLEVVLGPLWAWLGAGEVPARATLAGGAVVLMALAANEIGMLRQKPV